MWWEVMWGVRHEWCVTWNVSDVSHTCVMWMMWPMCDVRCEWWEMWAVCVMWDVGDVVRCEVSREWCEIWVMWSMCDVRCKKCEGCVMWVMWDVSEVVRCAGAKEISQLGNFLTKLLWQVHALKQETMTLISKASEKQTNQHPKSFCAHTSKPGT